MRLHLVTLLAVAFLAPAYAQSSCSTSLIPTNSVNPTVVSGYSVQLVATGLAEPRSIQFDTAGNLLIVESGAGNGSLSAITFTDNGGPCLVVKSKTSLVSNQGLNHGLALSSDGKTLYASSSDSAWSWAYDANQISVSSQRVVVANMDSTGHTSRTLLLSEKVNGMLLISRGSASNLDLDAANISSGHSQIKAFDVTNMSNNAYDFSSEGLLLGWGLRNSVGVAEHPLTGGIYSVENAADDIDRDGQDVHQDNPGEELNFHGYLNGTEYASQGQNYGYPFCYAAWDVAELPENSNLTVGKQFAIDPTNGQGRTDVFCAAQIPPRLTLQAHLAPLDLKFNNSGTEAWVTSHGSWDRTDPVGYKLSIITFGNGEPVAAPDNTTALVDVFSNKNNTVCPDNCFRPVGLAFDNKGRLFVSSDTTGELYVLVRDETATTTSTTSGSAAHPTHTGSAMCRNPSHYQAALCLGILICLFI